MEKPKQFKLIKQPAGSRVCGAASCAMAVGKSLEEVMAEYDWKEMTHTSGVARYLCRHGITMGLWFPDYSGFPEACRIELDPKDHPAIVSVESAIYKDADHWVFWDGQQILDPSPGEQDEYKILEVHFLTYWPEPPWLPELDNAEWWEAAKR